jgi:transcriptional regulator with XRE-family HTH domain
LTEAWFVGYAALVVKSNRVLTHDPGDPGTLGTALRDLRQLKRLDTTTAAMKGGMSEDRLLSIEGDQVQPRFLEVVALADVYGTPIDMLDKCRAAPNSLPRQGVELWRRMRERSQREGR